MTTFKKWLKATTAVLTLAALVGVVYGFATSGQPVKKDESPRQSFQQWHQISITGMNPENPSQQSLSLDSIATPPQKDEEGCAREDNEGIPCSILLEVPSEDYSFPSSLTVADLPTGGVSIVMEGSNPVYARQPAD